MSATVLWNKVILNSSKSNTSVFIKKDQINRVLYDFAWCYDNKGQMSNNCIYDTRDNMFYYRTYHKFSRADLMQIMFDIKCIECPEGAYCDSDIDSDSASESDSAIDSSYSD